MKSLILVWRLGVLLMVPGLCIPSLSAAEFRAGAYAMDVTPTNFPTQLSGGFLPIIATNALDPLYARSLVLDDGTNRVGICILDNCLISREYADEARALMAQKSGIPVERLTLACTHNHSSPSLMECHGAATDTNYARWLLPRLAEGMRLAVARLEPARVGWAVTQTWEHSFNRRWVRRPDRVVIDPFGESTARVQMNPGHESPDVVGPAGPKDPDLSLLAVETRGGQPLCVLANFANHYFGVSGGASADYFSVFGRELGEMLRQQAATNSSRAPEFVGIMSQGTSGDINRFNFAAPPSTVTLRQYAREMATLASEAYRRIQFHDWAPLGMRNQDVPFATRFPEAKRLAWARDMVARLNGRDPKTLPEIYAAQQLWLHENPRRRASLQALRIGELGIVAASAEVYAMSGLKIKAQSPLTPTFWITLANGNDGYIPTPEQYHHGGYTTWPTRSSSLETNAEPIIVENLLQMLEAVAGQPRRKVVERHGPYAQAVLAAEPLAYWRLNEFDAESPRDASGHNYPAQLTGGVCHYLPGVESVPGFTTVAPMAPNPFSGSEINRAIHLVAGTLSASFGATGRDFSVELWFWNGLPNDFRAATAELLRLGDEAVGIGGTNQTPGALWLANATSVVPSSSGPSITGRTWHHLVYVQQGPERLVYLNGTQALKGSGQNLPSSAVRTLAIGGAPETHASLEGKIDEVAVYSRAITQTEAAAHYALGMNAPAKSK